MHPTDQISIELEYFCDPKRTSGGLYHNVTTKYKGKIFKKKFIINANNC